MAGPDRFDRQSRFAPLGESGQARIHASRVLLVGSGALGGSLAQTLVRCGVGELVLVDRDIVEETNLPRQVLFSEAHLGLPKAQCAAETLALIGGPSQVEAHAAHVDAENLEDLAEGCDLVLDGTDNLATRYLINDWSVQTGTPWVYGGVVGSGGLVLPVIPGRGACLRCVFPDPPPPGALATCDTAGVLLPAVSAIAALQSGFALRWLGSDTEARAKIEPRLTEIDVWTHATRQLQAPRAPECPCCARREFPFLDTPAQRSAVSLCGRNTVQVRPALPTAASPAARPDLARIRAAVSGDARDLRDLGSFLRFEIETYRVTVFADGRALIEGTDDIDRARAVYDRYVGC